MSFNMDDIVKEQLDSMTNMDEDWLIQAFDIDEDAVIEFKRAIKHCLSIVIVVIGFEILIKERNIK